LPWGWVFQGGLIIIAKKEIYQTGYFRKKYEKQAKKR
jgi:hypothetical protein